MPGDGKTGIATRREGPGIADQQSEDRKFLRTIIIGVLALLALITAVFVVTFLLSGQEDKSGTEVFQQTPPATPPATQTTQQPGPAASTIKVQEREMSIRLSSNRARAGAVTLEAANNGAVPHQLVVLKTSNGAADLGSGNTVPEPGRTGGIPNLNPGQSRTLSIRMTPGHYALICNLPGHYSAGMHADLQVTR